MRTMQSRTTGTERFETVETLGAEAPLIGSRTYGFSARRERARPLAGSRASAFAAAVTELAVEPAP